MKNKSLVFRMVLNIKLGLTPPFDSTITNTIAATLNIIQSVADRKDKKKFHDALKNIYGPKSSGATTLLSADGSSLLTDEEAILVRWAEH